MAMRRGILLLLLVLLGGGCDGDPVGARHDETRYQQPALHSGGSDAGVGADNPGFAWLKPIVENAVAAGMFAASLRPTVILKECSGEDCRGARTIGISGETAGLMPASVHAGHGGSRMAHYHSSWRSGTLRPDPDNRYRIEIRVQGALLGHAEVHVVRQPADLAHVDRTRYVGLTAGHELTLRFRINEHAMEQIVDSVHVVPPDVELLVGGAPLQMTATLTGSDGTVITGPSITWSSSDESIASVNGSGFVTARGAGHAAITATSQGRSATAEVVVAELIESSISVGEVHGCGISTGGLAYCWGENTSGQLGTGSTLGSPVPVAVYAGGALAGRRLGAISVGTYDYTIALDTDGNAYGWGNNEYGQLGTGTLDGSLFPVRAITTGTTLRSVSAGSFHTMALDVRGRAWGWGYNVHGQLGTGTTQNSSLPVPVVTEGALAGKRLASITSGFFHTAALDEQGRVFAWGYNGTGQLGTGDHSSRAAPVAITRGALAGRVVRLIEAGHMHTMALDSDGRAYGWGSNTSGQLGTGNDLSSAVPTPVLTSGVLKNKTLNQISAGGYHTVALDTDGTAYAWGFNDTGALGTGTTISSPAPMAVYAGGALAGRKLRVIAAGGFHSTALDTEGKAYSWGSNASGQLGAGEGPNSLLPIPIGPNLIFR